jgi:hypothetical protein
LNFAHRDSNQEIIGAIVVNQDITERKQAEEEREYLFKQVCTSQEQLQSLSRRLMEVQEADAVSSQASSMIK